ncbi:hypothetical protein A0H81_06427 [Grifola frondosa]|uniref:Uncharacterized protein n=1 Tax=Grifola frondosa TaxID=5627 RepID=A0A1C7MA75_GRIFR|nr:hypothetical protein A0H81_06427 [Grifola frondosa]
MSQLDEVILVSTSVLVSGRCSYVYNHGCRQLMPPANFHCIQIIFALDQYRTFLICAAPTLKLIVLDHRGLFVSWSTKAIHALFARVLTVYPQISTRVVGQRISMGCSFLHSLKSRAIINCRHPEMCNSSIFV